MLPSIILQLIDPRKKQYITYRYIFSLILFSVRFIQSDFFEGRHKIKTSRNNLYEIKRRDDRHEVGVVERDIGGYRKERVTEGRRDGRSKSLKE